MKIYDELTYMRISLKILYYCYCDHLSLIDNASLYLLSIRKYTECHRTLNHPLCFCIGVLDTPPRSLPYSMFLYRYLGYSSTLSTILYVSLSVYWLLQHTLPSSLFLYRYLGYSKTLSTILHVSLSVSWIL